MSKNEVLYLCKYQTVPSGISILERSWTKVELFAKMCQKQVQMTYGALYFCSDVKD